jgi:hypothetical protein
MAMTTTTQTCTAPPQQGKHEWQLPPLPDEVLLHVFNYLDLNATVAALRVSRHWHELANDPRYPPPSPHLFIFFLQAINYFSKLFNYRSLISLFCPYLYDF